MPTTRRSPSLIGIALVVVGVILLIQTMDWADLGDWYRWLPVLVIAAGAIQLYTSGFRAILGPSLVMAAGVVLLLAALGVISWETLGALWPAILIFFGISVLMGHRSSAKAAAQGHPGERISAVAVLGGTDRRIGTKTFRGGDATAIMGGADLDFRDADVADRPATINVNVLMGGIDLKVPETWNIDIQATVLLGGIDDERKGHAPQEEGPPHLLITGLVLMGGVSIKS